MSFLHMSFKRDILLHCGKGSKNVALWVIRKSANVMSDVGKGGIHTMDPGLYCERPVRNDSNEVCQV